MVGGQLSPAVAHYLAQQGSSPYVANALPQAGAPTAQPPGMPSLPSGGGPGVSPFNFQGTTPRIGPQSPVPVVTTPQPGYTPTPSQGSSLFGQGIGAPAAPPAPAAPAPAAPAAPDPGWGYNQATMGFTGGT